MSEKLLSKTGAEIAAHFKTKVRTQCIYAITHIPTGNKYVGKSVNVAIRWREHFRALSSGKANPNFQAAWDSDGPAAFLFHVLEVVEDSADLTKREQYWLENLIAGHDGHFNLCPNAGTTRGRVTTEATRERMRGPRTYLRRSKLASSPRCP